MSSGGRIAVPGLATGDGALDAHAEAVKSVLDRLSGQSKNSVPLARLPATASDAERLAQLNLIIDRLQGVPDPGQVTPIITPPAVITPPVPTPTPAPTPAPPGPAPAPAPVPAPPPPAPVPAPAPGSAPYVPFGSIPDGAYPYGITCNNYTVSQRITRLTACYDAWKAHGLKSATFTASTGIFAGQTLTGKYLQFGDTSFATVSEGQGYAMLLLVLFAGWDSNAQADFDACYRVARGRPAYSIAAPNGQYLMEWRLYPGDLSSAGDGYGAGDGDLDIALALLMAHRQWGSGGVVNYYQQALNTINAMRAAYFGSSGAARGVPYDAYHDVTRTSDFMCGHFRAFKKATNDTFWDDASANCRTLAASITSTYSPTYKLQPGFIYSPFGAHGTAKPDNVVDVDHQGISQYFDGNATRNPWRFAMKPLYDNDAGWKTLTTDLATSLAGICANDPTQLSFAFRLDGSRIGGTYFAESTAGPLLAACLLDSSKQSLVNTLFTECSAIPPTGGYGFTTDYYDSELMLIPLVVAAGFWWEP